MTKEITPDYIFETSWEVCNQVGGIYTVLSTRAKTLQATHKDKLIFVGPDFWKEEACPFFTEVPSLLKPFKAYIKKNSNIDVRVGRWEIPGKPLAILIDYAPFYKEEFCNEIYGKMWDSYGVNSLNGFGDYHESAVFGTLVGKLVESFYTFKKLDKKTNVIAHFNEWQTAFGLLYLKENVPAIGTVFTTHATSIGRSICGNGKPLYGHLSAYNGDQMADELNMSAKHSAEKKAAHMADCFTTVSDVTAVECTQLLEKKPDVVTPNGFENGFVPTGKKFDEGRKIARKTLRKVSETLLGYKISKNAIFLGTCGRYEYLNKGLDAFIESCKQLSEKSELKKEIIAFIMVPGYMKGPRIDLQDKLKNKSKEDLPNNYITHDLVEPANDPVTSAIKWFYIENRKEDKVKVIFVPSYLNGNDGIFNKSYYELLIGFDITAFPSYYEPWGYTPLESVAFSIPTITTNLSGFGQWSAQIMESKGQDLSEGVGVVNRTDENYHEMVNEMTKNLLAFALNSATQVEKTRAAAHQLSQQVLWKKFIVYYKETYTFALAKK